MNNYFDLTRFVNLFKKHLSENLKLYLMSLIVLGGILILFFCYLSYMTPVNLAFPNVQFVIYFPTFLLSGCIFSSIGFSGLGDKKNAIAALLLPSSKIEKFLVPWIYVFILFPIFFTALFYALDALFLFSLNPKDDKRIEFYNVFSPEGNRHLVFIVYLLLASVAFLGAILFEKIHFIKIAAIFFVFAFCFLWLNTFFLSYLTTWGIGPSMPFSGLRFDYENNNVALNVDNDIAYMVGTVCTIAPLLWLSTYLKLKEKEV